MTSEVIINEVNATKKSGQHNQRVWRSKENSAIPPRTDNFQFRKRNEDNRQIPRGSYTHILVNPTQLSDAEFTAWMDRLVEVRRNRQENKLRPYRQLENHLWRTEESQEKQHRID